MNVNMADETTADSQVSVPSPHIEESPVPVVQTLITPAKSRKAKASWTLEQTRKLLEFLYDTRLQGRMSESGFKQAIFEEAAAKQNEPSLLDGGVAKDWASCRNKWNQVSITDYFDRPLLTFDVAHSTVQSCLLVRQ